MFDSCSHCTITDGTERSLLSDKLLDMTSLDTDPPTFIAPVYEKFEYIDDPATGVELETTDSDDRITEPFDPTMLRIETKPLTLDLLILRLQYSEIDLAPSFQRQGGIWKDLTQSRLIESILIRIPLPAFYFDATDNDRWLVVDSQQRLATLKRFVIDKDLRLSGLEFLDHLNGKGYDDLHRSFQRRILETQVTVNLIEEGTPSRVKFDIFKRINTGRLPLSAQEIRHALNQGKAAELLVELVGSEEFKRATDNGIRGTRMDDRECVLRFLSFTLVPYTRYKDTNLDSFLNERMSDINKMSDQDIEHLRRQFLRAMAAAFDIFGTDAFRKRYAITARRYPISKALFEAWSVNLSRLDDDQLHLLYERRKDLIQRFVSLMAEDGDFDNAISQGTGNARKVYIRFSAIERIIGEVLR